MHRDWEATLITLEKSLPVDLYPTAFHHSAHIQEPDESHETRWFSNDDGEFPIAAVEGMNLTGTHLHTATAPKIHFRVAPADPVPHLDVWCCRLNELHDCMPDVQKPWESEGRAHLCVPSPAPHLAFMPVGYVFPLGTVI